MFSVPASPHFVRQALWVETQEARHFGTVLSEENQFAMLPVLPSRPINSELAGRLTGRPTVPAARVEESFGDGCGRWERVVPEEAEDRRQGPDRRFVPTDFPVQDRPGLTPSR